MTYPNILEGSRDINILEYLKIPHVGKVIEKNQNI